MLYMLTRDQSCNWFIIPVDRRDEWNAWLHIPEDDPQSWNPPSWAQVIDGPHHVGFAQWSDLRDSK